MPVVQLPRRLSPQTRSYGKTDLAQNARSPDRLSLRGDRLCFVLAGLILVTSLVTRAEWGLVQILPYKLHLVADVLVGLFSLLCPILFRFADDPTVRNAFIVFGLFGIGAGVLSQPDEMPPMAV